MGVCINLYYIMTFIISMSEWMNVWENNIKKLEIGF